MKRRIAIFMTMVMALVTCFSICPSTANAETDSTVLETHTCTVDGIERSLTVYENRTYLKVGDLEPQLVSTTHIDIGFDEVGTIWEIGIDNFIRWYNYDLMPDDIYFDIVEKPLTEYPDGSVNDAQSLIFDENNKFVIGYTTFDGETHPILTLDEMQAILSPSTAPTPTPSTNPESVPTPTPTPSTNPGNDPTPTPVVTPSTTPQVTPSPTPVVTPEPTVAPDETPAPSISTKLSLKKESGYSCLYTGDTVTAKYKLTKKGVLTWKSGSKTKKIKGVKSAGFIKKSKNLIYMTKKGKVFTISSKGKKKTIVKKGAKKLVVKNKYVTKVKVKVSGKVKNVNVTKK